jgi:tetratricopeptide (TPR) repeat protein
MMSSSIFSKGRILTLLSLFFFLFSIYSCVSHLKEAKFYYDQGQRFSRSLEQGKAVASFKRALKEAELETEKHPSAQAYMLKGLAELELKLWKEAGESFRQAFSCGFDKGEEWAKQVSLLGLASSLDKMGLKEAAFKIYAHLIERSKLDQILLVASQKYTEMALEKTSQKSEQVKKKELSSLLKSIQKLSQKDMSNGFYHYLQSQIHSYLLEYEQSFEEAVMAKELFLPSERITRDNDLQIVFCYQKLKEKLSSRQWEKFFSSYLQWIKKWRWQDPETPEWKKR